jgi:hypothetical protein
MIAGNHFGLLNQADLAIGHCQHTEVATSGTAG